MELLYLLLLLQLGCLFFIISISCEKEDDTNSSPSTPSEPRY